MIKLNIQRFGSTNKTTNYELSQFVSSDKPSWLNDYDSDMSKIDTAIHTAKTTADGAATAAGNAATAAEGAQNTANTAVTNAATAQSAADSANSKIGTLANLETTTKTDLVSAINEVNSAATASEVVNSLATDYTNKAPSTKAVNDVLSRTDTEHLCGTWFGKPLYEKTISLGNLPDSTQKTVDTGLVVNDSNCVIREMYGCCNTTTGVTLTLPFVGSSQTANITLDVANNNLIVETYSNRSALHGYVIIRYTKATD